MKKNTINDKIMLARKKVEDASLYLVKKEDLTNEVEITEEKEVKKVSLKEIDDRLMTIDDFLN